MWQCSKYSSWSCCWLADWLWENCIQKCLQVSKPNISVQIQWETFMSQSLRVPTDVTPTGEAKMDSHTQQQHAVKAKSQGFQESQSLRRIQRSHQHNDGRRSTFSVLQSHPDVFTSSHERPSQVYMGWSCAGNYVMSPSSLNWQRYKLSHAVSGCNGYRFCTRPDKPINKQNKWNHLCWCTRDDQRHHTQ